MNALNNTDAELGVYFSTLGALRISQMFRVSCGISAVARVLQEDAIAREAQDDFEPLGKRNFAGLLEAVRALSASISVEAQELAEHGGFDPYCGDPLPDGEVKGEETVRTPEQAARQFIETMKACDVPVQHTGTVMAMASAWAKAAELRKERQLRGRPYGEASD